MLLSGASAYLSPLGIVVWYSDDLHSKELNAILIPWHKNMLHFKQELTLKYHPLGRYLVLLEVCKMDRKVYEQQSLGKRLDIIMCVSLWYTFRNCFGICIQAVRTSIIHSHNSSYVSLLSLSWQENTLLWKVQYCLDSLLLLCETWSALMLVYRETWIFQVSKWQNLFCSLPHHHLLAENAPQSFLWTYGGEENGVEGTFVLLCRCCPCYKSELVLWNSNWLLNLFSSLCNFLLF